MIYASEASIMLLCRWLTFNEHLYDFIVLSFPVILNFSGILFGVTALNFGQA